MLSPQEVAKHNTLDDLWLIVKGQAFNLSKFAPEHPGGYKILLKCEHLLLPRIPGLELTHAGYQMVVSTRREFVQSFSGERCENES